MRVAINGFGRIGRSLLRTILEDEKASQLLDVVIINIGPASIEHVAYTFKYDTIMRTFPGSVYFKDNHLIVGSRRIRVIAECDPRNISWYNHSIDWVIDCSGCFTHRDDAERHLVAGCKYILISAPAHGEDICIIPGVNEHRFDPVEHRIISLGSCTTNAFAPVLDVLHKAFILEAGALTTIHAYTNNQVLLDVECRSKDIRRSRAAALNIIPTTTGAASVVVKILPELTGKITARAVRIPVADVSFLDFTFMAQKMMSIELINKAFYEASKRIPHIIAVSMDPLVSSDYIGDSHSIVLDGLLTNVNKNLAQICGWYDNEWGYSCRIKDFLLTIA